jgi:hypothetical protein
VAWSQRRSDRRDAAPHARISRTWSGEDWGEARVSHAVRPWVALDAEGRDWGIRPAIGGAPAAAVGVDGEHDLPDAMMSDRNGNLSARPVRTAALAPYAGGRGRLLVRRLGADVAVLVDEGSGWRALGQPTSLDDPRFRAVGAPAVASTPDGQVLVAWVVAGAIGPEGANAAGLAARHWDGQAWRTLSDPTAPALLDPWPEGPERVSERTRRDRRAQARWRKRWGRRSATDWPSPVAVALTDAGPVVSWDPTGGRALLRHDGAAWHRIRLPGEDGEGLALGRRRDGGLRVARVRDGALLVHDLVEGRLRPRPGLPSEGAGMPALDGDLLAWRQEVTGGSTIRVARWEGHWAALGTPAAPPAGDHPGMAAAAVAGTPGAPVVVSATDGPTAHLTPWTLADGRWTAGASTPAAHGRPRQATRTDAGLLVTWTDRRARRAAMHAARLEADGTWSSLPGPGPDGALLASPRPGDAVLALGEARGTPTALVRDGTTVQGLQFAEGRWWSRLPTLPLPGETPAVAAALGADGRALVAAWIPRDEAVGLAVHRLEGEAWVPVPLSGACQPTGHTPVSLDVAAGPADTWAIAWRTQRPTSRQAGPTTVCRLDGDRWTTLPPAPAPEDGRIPRSTEPMPVSLAWAGTDLVLAARGMGPYGPATVASRWDGAAWQPLATTPTGAPTGPGGLLADETGACLWWTAEATDGPRVAITCAARGDG